MAVRMNAILLFSVLLFHIFSFSDAQTKSQGLFLFKYKVDIDKVISNKRVLIHYTNCLLDKGPCTPEANELKKIIPNAVATQCKDCSEEEKKAVGKIFSHLLQNHRDLWDQLLTKFDPEGTFRKQYEFDEDDYDDTEE